LITFKQLSTDLLYLLLIFSAGTVCPPFSAGSNGSGKTTITERLLTHSWTDNAACINPDIIAQEQFGGWNLLIGNLSISPNTFKQFIQLKD
jgi:hypothetical protein